MRPPKAPTSQACLSVQAPLLVETRAQSALHLLGFSNTRDNSPPLLVSKASRLSILKLRLAARDWENCDTPRQRTVAVPTHALGTKLASSSASSGRRRTSIQSPTSPVYCNPTRSRVQVLSRSQLILEARSSSSSAFPKFCFLNIIIA